MYLVDENFGILKRDVEIAKLLKKCKEKSVFYHKQGPQDLIFSKILSKNQKYKMDYLKN